MYVITSTNNGMYTIDHFRDRSYVASSLSVIFTSLGWDGTPLRSPDPDVVKRIGC